MRSRRGSVVHARSVERANQQFAAPRRRGVRIILYSSVRGTPPHLDHASTVYTRKSLSQLGILKTRSVINSVSLFQFAVSNLLSNYQTV